MLNGNGQCGGKEVGLSKLGAQMIRIRILEYTVNYFGRRLAKLPGLIT